MGSFLNLLGTLRDTFRIGPAGTNVTLSAAGITSPRTVTLRDEDGVLALASDIKVGSQNSAPNLLVADADTPTLCGPGLTLPANYLAAGDSIRLDVFATGEGLSSTNTLSLRLGTTNTDADPVLLTATLGAGDAALGVCRVGYLVSFPEIGASGSITAVGSALNNGSTGFTNAPYQSLGASINDVDTTVELFLGVYLSVSVAEGATIKTTSALLAKS